jgi:type IX secretion system PorP/SprF family membrane protein
MKNLIRVIWVLLPFLANAQDPHFTQFNAAPFTANPANAGVFNGNIRIMSNYRQQWGNLSDPFTTASIALDGKLGRYEGYGQNPFNLGIQLMSDRSMAGAFRSTYATGVASYHVPMDEDGIQSLGAGLSVTYGNRQIDFASVTFDEQFFSGGFDLSAPNGEAALQNMKPFASVGAGLLYVYNNAETGTFFDLGLSGYHFNKPKQTVLQDPNEFLPIRYSAQASFQQYVNEQLLLNIRALYQNQARVEYLMGGVSIARTMGDEGRNMVGAGLWYRTGDAVSPHVFMEFNRMQIGLSYDVTTSSLKQGPKAARSFELSLQWRLGTNEN